jgi:hypothetical protein
MSKTPVIYSIAGNKNTGDEFIANVNDIGDETLATKSVYLHLK